jgi:hypothetical protein
MLGLLAALLVQDAAAEGKVTPRNERHSAVRIELSGHFDVHAFYRDGALNRAAGGIGGAVPAENESDAMWTGRFALRADVELKDAVRGVLEIENRSFDEGENLRLGADPEEDSIHLKQGYVEAGEFLSPTLALRLGIQGVAYRNRPHDEPFFLALGESEGFFEGFSAAARHVRPTVDRDVREAAGARLLWEPYPVLGVQALALSYGDDGPDASGEAVYALAANARLADGLAAWLLYCLSVGGSAAEDARVSTLGAGADLYLGEGRELELFGEIYLQRGELAERPDVRKEAFAAQAGLRSVGLFVETLWAEAAFAHRSGNRRVTDSTDEAFQSYENENRFLILQSAEFGLDVDTNVSLLRAALGWGPLAVGGRPLRLQLDVGRFEADRALRAPGGAVLTARKETDWGTEGDLSATWSYNESLSLWVKGAWLLGSDLLELLTPGRDDDARVIAGGADLRF